MTILRVVMTVHPLFIIKGNLSRGMGFSFKKLLLERAIQKLAGRQKCRLACSLDYVVERLIFTPVKAFFICTGSFLRKE